MGKNKLKRFAEIDRFKNVFELTDFNGRDNSKPKGRWKEVFGNENPITLELACGKGRYTVELARRNLERNYIGVDIKGSRIWKGARKARENDLDNVRFLRIYIDHLHEYFAEGEVNEIWITFPDPYPRGSNRSKRLTSQKFLGIYQKVLKREGVIHLKTDSEALYQFSRSTVEKYGCRILDRADNVYGDRDDDETLTIKTDFEIRHLQKGKTIKYMQFSLPAY